MYSNLALTYYWHIRGSRANLTTNCSFLFKRFLQGSSKLYTVGINSYVEKKRLIKHFFCWLQDSKKQWPQTWLRHNEIWHTTVLLLGRQTHNVHILPSCYLLRVRFRMKVCSWNTKERDFLQFLDILFLASHLTKTWLHYHTTEKLNKPATVIASLFCFFC